jgi:hypothetical protein
LTNKTVAAGSFCRPLPTAGDQEVDDESDFR